jgi:xanthine/uracil/vitamin C permease (AzgA family)
MGLWPSVGLGVGFGLAYLALSLITHRLARRFGVHAIQVELGGVVARLLLAAVAVLVVLLVVPVARGAFAMAFLATFTLGLVFDVARLVRRALRASPSRPA